MKKLILLLLICAIAAVAVYMLVFRDTTSGNNGSEGVKNEGDESTGGSIKDTAQSALYVHPNKDPEKAKASLEAAGYYAKLIPHNDREDGLIARVEGSLNTAETPDDFECINIYYYESEVAAEAAWPELQKEGEEVKEVAAYLGYGSSVVCKRNGTVIYYGTKNAVDAAK